MRPLPATQRIQDRPNLDRPDQDRLEQSRRLEAIGRLTGGVAHDFNNLLTVILSAMESLAEADLGPEDRRLAEVSLEAAERGADLIRRLLAFARPAPRIISGAPLSADAGAAIESTARLLHRTLPDSIVLHAQIPNGLAYCRADRSELESVLLNLAVNARDAMADGGRLTLCAAPVTLERAEAQRLGAAAGGHILFTVEDTGAGMSPETLARAIEPFFSTKQARGGTGLGLSAAHSLAVGSGGALNIASRLGQGTRVELYIPRSRSAAQPELDLGPQPEAQLACDVLLVEDEPAVRAQAARLLRDMGCRVAEASDAEDALAALSGGAPLDLLITDIDLPFGLDGKALAEIGRSLRPDLKVLFTSGGLDAAGGAGADFLPKPFGRASLSAAVQRQLQRRDLSQSSLA